MDRSGFKCFKPGIYRSDCKHKKHIALKSFDNFPHCPIDSESVIWTLVREKGNYIPR